MALDFIYSFGINICLVVICVLALYGVYNICMDVLAWGAKRFFPDEFYGAAGYSFENVHNPAGMMGQGTRPVSSAHYSCGDCGETYVLDQGHVCPNEEPEARKAREDFIRAYAGQPIKNVNTFDLRLSSDPCNICDADDKQECAILYCKNRARRVQA